jgi:hypothetical protein
MLGNAHAYDLFDRVIVQRRSDVAVARDFPDYAVSINTAGMPATVKLLTKVG